MVENAQLFELAFRDANGRLVPVTGGGALFDEQTAVPDTISQLNSHVFLTRSTMAAPAMSSCTKCPSTRRPIRRWART